MPFVELYQCSVDLLATLVCSQVKFCCCCYIFVSKFGNQLIKINCDVSQLALRLGRSASQAAFYFECFRYASGKYLEIFQ